MRANYSPTKSLIPPARFQNPNLNPNRYNGRYKKFSGRIRFPDYSIGSIYHLFADKSKSFPSFYFILKPFPLP